MNIDEMVEYWHTHETSMSLQEFLNMSDDEYEKFLKDTE